MTLTWAPAFCPGLTAVEWNMCRDLRVCHYTEWETERCESLSLHCVRDREMWESVIALSERQRDVRVCEKQREQNIFEYYLCCILKCCYVNPSPLIRSRRWCLLLYFFKISSNCHLSHFTSNSQKFFITFKICIADILYLKEVKIAIIVIGCNKKV